MLLDRYYLGNRTLSAIKLLTSHTIYYKVLPMIVIVSHWSNGAYVNSIDPELYQEMYAELYSLYGTPAITSVEVR